MPPFRIFGNLYFVGTHPASSHLIDTGDGLILLDSGYPQTLYLVLENIRTLGFSPCDLKYIIHSHGHYDHLGATRALVELTGAKTFIGRQDAAYANGKLDLTWARELGHEYYEQFEPDVLLEDGDRISRGNTEVLCLHTPGHTPGTMSYFFPVSDGIHIYRAGMHGGVGTNSMSKEFLDRYGLSYDCRKQFLDGLDRLKQEKVDIFIGNHVWNNDTRGKYERMREQSYNSFINENDWLEFLKKSSDQLFAMIEKEETECENISNSGNRR